MGTNLNARKSTSPKHGSRYHRGKLDPLVLLLRAKPLLRHDPSSFPSSFSHNAWSRKARSGHALLDQIVSPDPSPRSVQYLLGARGSKTLCNRWENTSI